MDIDLLYQPNEISSSPVAEYAVNFSTPGTYTLWLRGYPANAAGDSAYVGWGDDRVEVTGFAPGQWSWANLSVSGTGAVTLPVESSGLYTVSLWMREDGLRIDRLLLTTDTNYLPTGFGPLETGRAAVETSGPTYLLERTLVYTYDNLSRLTGAGYTSGETYAYGYDPVGNRLQQVINGDTTSYTYDTANRIESVDGQNYTYDNNGNLLATGVLTNVFDAANRLTSTSRDETTLQPIYNGMGDRVGQTVGTTTTNYVLDVVGLPEVIYTSDGEVYLHLPGVIVTEKAGTERYLLSDGLGSIRQVVDETAEVIAYQEFDPYGNPVNTTGGDPYGFTGEWWEDEVQFLYLRARWYMPETGTFLSKDLWEGDKLQSQSMNGWSYAEGNPVRYTDPSGHCIGPLTPACILVLAALFLTSCVENQDLDITVHFHILDGSGPVNPQQYLDYTNALFLNNDVGVTVKQGTVKKYTVNETVAILGEDKWLLTSGANGYDDPNAPEVAKLLSNNLDGGVDTYFVQALVSGLLGKAYPDRGAFVIPTNPQAVFSGYQPQSDRSFPHELGHLIHGAAESDNPHNYMATDGFVIQSGVGLLNANVVTLAQAEAIRQFARNNP